MGESSQKPIKIDSALWDELDKWLKTPSAKSYGFHSKAQFVTESVRNLLQKYRSESQVYEKLSPMYEKNKERLALKGMNSFSGYVSFMLDEAIKKDKSFARYVPKIEKISVDDDTVILKDNIKNKIAEVVLQKGELFCKLCKKKACVHVGFVFSLPDIYEVLNARKMKHPK